MPINEAQINDIIQASEDVIRYNEFESCLKMIGEIDVFIDENSLESVEPALFARLNRLIVRLKWVAMNIFNREEVFDLFSSHLQEAFSMGEYLDLSDKFRSFLLGVTLHEERDEIKSNIKNILNRSQAQLTSKKLASGQSPTVENWLKLYISSLGIGIVDKLKLNQFYLNDLNFRNLSDPEKEKVKKFFAFYEKLKLSSLTVEGIEEPVPVATPDFEGWIHDGIVERTNYLRDKNDRLNNQAQAPVEASPSIGNINPQASRIEELKILLQQYPEGSLERKAISEEIDKMNGE